MRFNLIGIIRIGDSFYFHMGFCLLFSAHIENEIAEWIIKVYIVQWTRRQMNVAWVEYHSHYIKKTTQWKWTGYNGEQNKWFRQNRKNQETVVVFCVCVLQRSASWIALSNWRKTGSGSESSQVTMSARKNYKCYTKFRQHCTPDIK